MVNADKYVVVKLPERRPVGWLKNVNQTCLDLRVPRLLKKAFPLVEGFGYNHTFKLFKGSERKAFNLAVRYMSLFQTYIFTYVNYMTYLLFFFISLILLL